MKDPRCASLFFTHSVGNLIKGNSDDVNCDERITGQFKLSNRASEKVVCPKAWLLFGYIFKSIYLFFMRLGHRVRSLLLEADASLENINGHF